MEAEGVRAMTDEFAGRERWPGLRPGRFARLQEHEKCRHCAQPRVRGLEVCRTHGGGQETARRARAVLVNPRTELAAKERAARRLGKLERNRVRAYREGDLALEGGRLEAEAVMGEVRTLIRAQAMTPEFVAKAKRAAMALRPYRETDAALASATYARGVARGERAAAFDGFCSALSLDADERNHAAGLLGLRR